MITSTATTSSSLGSHRDLCTGRLGASLQCCLAGPVPLSRRQSHDAPYVALYHSPLDTGATCPEWHGTPEDSEQGAGGTSLPSLPMLLFAWVLSVPALRKPQCDHHKPKTWHCHARDLPGQPRTSQHHLTWEPLEPYLAHGQVEAQAAMLWLHNVGVSRVCVYDVLFTKPTGEAVVGVRGQHVPPQPGASNDTWEHYCHQGCGRFRQGVHG